MEATTQEMQSPTIGMLAVALSKAQGQMNGASKDSENPFFKSKYADLYQCIEASKKQLSDNELCVIQTLKDSVKGITIITTLAHSSGEWIRGEITMTPKKDDDQGRGSSITYGRRYAYAAIVGLAQKDDDDANESCSQKDTKGSQSKKYESKSPSSDEKESREMLEKWEKYIDGFTDKNIDLFTAACDQYINAAIKTLPKSQADELIIAKNEMTKHLQGETI